MAVRLAGETKVAAAREEVAAVAAWTEVDQMAMAGVAVATWVGAVREATQAVVAV